jgi:hypothetical protein
MGWHRCSAAKRIAIISSLIIGAGLFINTYFVNIIVYQNPIPQCGQVLGVERCHTYAPWARNYADALANKGVDINPLVFIGNWIYGMFDRVFFVINGPGPVRSYDNHIAPVIAITAATLGIFAIVLLFRYGKDILKQDKILVFLLFTSFAYIVALVGRNYHDYLHLGKIVAINGRYLLPVLLPVYLIIVQCYQEFLKNKPLFRDVFFIIIFLLFLQGGGVISYLYYSNPAYWFWPNDRFVNSVSRSVKKVINPVFINNQRIPFLITTKDKIYTKFNIQ